VETPSVLISKVYNFAMATYIMIQVHGVDAPARIRADKVETTGSIGKTDYVLKLTKDGKEVGEFNGTVVDGWWVLEG
jgi:hypothetical protein